MPPPVVSIVIVNWNGADILPRCLEAVMAQKYRDFEVILVDNASSDRSVLGIEARWPDVQVIRLDQNIGFAAANNLGARRARGRWLATLNNDAFPEPGWLDALIGAAEKNTEYRIIASCLLKADHPHYVEACGDIYHTSGLAWHRDRNRPYSQIDHGTNEVFSACAAAALYDRSAFLNVGGFDEDYFGQHEDVDLGFRLRLQGYRCLFVPDAIVHHIGSASFGVESDQAVYLMHRNFVWTYIKDMPGFLFWRYLPAHLLANLLFMLHYLLRGQSKPILRAKLDAIRGCPMMGKKRKQIQRHRTVDPNDMRLIMDRGWLSPYLLGKFGERLRKDIHRHTNQESS